MTDAPRTTAELVRPVERRPGATDVAVRQVRAIDALALDGQGFRLVARLGNGADAVGVTVAEQPEVLVLEDPLPMMTGEQVVAEVRDYAPHTVVAVHASDPRATTRLLRAGADRVFGRRASPADVARDLGRLLGARPLVQV